MADTITMKKFGLKTVVRIETILHSLTRENYKIIIDYLKQGLLEYDPKLCEKLDKYTWLVEKNLQGNTPSLELLKKEFEDLSFDNIFPIRDPGELSDYVTMFLTQKKNSFLSTKFAILSDKVRGRGLSDDDTMEVYRLLAESESDDDYVPISENFKDIYEKQEKLVGISFLSQELDNLTGGITPGQICTILGAPGSMKTTYSSNIAYNAVKSGKNVLYLSLEEPARQLFSKWMSRCSIDRKLPIPQQDIVQAKLDEKQKKVLYDTVDYFNEYEGKLYIIDEQNLSDYSLTTLESKFKLVDKLAREETGHGVDLLVVDHIQLLKFALTDRDTIATINFYVSFFRQQSLSWLHEKKQIAIILLSQANREGYAYAQKNQGQYLTQHVAEASEVERASAYIISVYTDAMSQLTKQLTLGAVKLRGSALPMSVIPIYADGSVYQVGDIVSSKPTITTPVESSISLTDINDMLGGV